MTSISVGQEGAVVPDGIVEVVEPPAPGARAARARPAGPGGRLRRRLVAVDVVAATLAWVLAAAITGAGTGTARVDAVCLAAIVVGTLAGLAQQRLYLARIACVRSEEVVRINRAALWSVLVALVVLAAAGAEPRAWALLGGYGAVVTTVVIGRGQFRGWLRRQRSRGRFLQPVVVFGADEEAAELLTLLRECPEVGLRPVGVVGSRPDGTGGADAVPWLGPVADAVAAIERSEATGVLIASGAMDAGSLNRVVRQLHLRGLHVHVSSGLALLHRRRLRIQPIAHEPLIYVEPPSLSGSQLAAKRAFDVVVAALALAAATPVLVAAAIAIRWTDGGPVFFRQWRVGRDGSLFRIWKLRTMSTDAELRMAELASENERDGPLFKVSDDPRVTRVGRVLRATSIDELPQLFNVLRGDMSMVGPRPALPEEVEQFDEELLDRLRVRPGVTGLWQVEARDKASFCQYRRLDLFYVENWSLALDVSVLLATVPTVLRRSLDAVRPRSDRAHARV